MDKLPEQETTALARRDPISSLAVQLKAEEWDLIKKTICPDATDVEAAYFLACCNSMGLDPRRQQVYFIKSDQRGRTTYNIYTSSSHIRSMVKLSGLIETEEGPFYAALPEDGNEPKWTKYWTSTKVPDICMVRSKRTDRPQMHETVRYFREVAKTYQDQYTKEKKLSGNWKTHPLEAFARVTWRKHFEDEYGDVVSSIGVVEEMPTPDEIKGEYVEERDTTTDAELTELFDQLKYPAEKREQMTAKYKDNRAGMLVKLKQEIAAKGIQPKPKDEPIDADFTEVLPPEGMDEIEQDLQAAGEEESDLADDQPGESESQESLEDFLNQGN